MSYDISLCGSSLRLRPGADEATVLERVRALLPASLGPANGEREETILADVQGAETLDDLFYAFNWTLLRDANGRLAGAAVNALRWTNFKQLLAALAPDMVQGSWVGVDYDGGGVGLFVIEADATVTEIKFPEYSMSLFYDDEPGPTQDRMFYESYPEHTPPYDLTDPKHLKYTKLARYWSKRPDLPACFSDHDW